MYQPGEVMQPVGTGLTGCVYAYPKPTSLSTDFQTKAVTVPSGHAPKLG